MARRGLFQPGGDGLHTIATFAAALAGGSKQIHLAGHSTGAVLLGHLLGALDDLNRADLVSSCSLMVPACTVDFYRDHYQPRLGPQNQNSPVTRLPKLALYCLSEELERDDNVAFAHRKSLLYLISRALERAKDKPVLGMARDVKKIASKPGLDVIVSKGGTSGRSTSTSHGGFDNDANTLNNIMRRILGNTAPPHPFTKKELEGF
jgi:hypothetical protein